MIRNNLATRPFYNERALHAWLFAIGLAVAAATVFNVVWVVRYTRSDTDLAARASRDEAGAAAARARTARLLASVDPRQLEYSSTEAQLANDLIDRRTFSWTGLFNQFQATLPDDVRITAVRPRLDAKRNILLTISVVAKTIEDVDQFMRRLDGTGVFVDVLSTDERPDEEGLIQASIVTTYVPSAAAGSGKGTRP
ncbi:MAG: PilN domain-containing protein [Vicinamibacterales bacterium]